MIAAIILAGGKGTRIKSKTKNKVTLPFLNKPLIMYAVELFEGIAASVVVVVGAFYQSVKDALKDHEIIFAHQTKRLGTAHAVKTGIKVFENNNPVPSIILVCYGDHTMFYNRKTVRHLIDIHTKKKATMSLITTIHEKPNWLAWGRIIRDKQGEIVNSVEQKDAKKDQLEINELNAGFYCFDYTFLKKNIARVQKSSVSGEYYINGLIKIASLQRKRIVGLRVPFEEVGIGINRPQELEESQKIYQEFHAKVN